MQLKNSLRIAAAVATMMATAEVPSPSYVGIQGLALIGVHRDAAGSQYGIGGGPLLQVHVGGPRVQLHLEGIPVISIPGVRPSERYGQATPALGIFNGQAEAAFDRAGYAFVGVGETIYNQRTPLPALGQTVSSRLAGVRYTMRYRRPLGARHFVDAFFGTAPTLTGADVYEFLSHATPVIKPERASEIDASLEWGYRYRHSEWLIGARTLNFTARYPLTGEAADRNVGIGPIIEWRELLH
jgi:hypothetical protein